MSLNQTEIASKAIFENIRYAQCWEDADILLKGLDIQPGDNCLGIGSAGENCFAKLTKDPALVVAVDLNPTQIYTIQLKIAAYRSLSHSDFLELMGSRPSRQRESLLKKCYPILEKPAKDFWEKQNIQLGVCSLGKFENYFALFRNKVLPFVHGKKKIETLLAGGDYDKRTFFYEKKWNSWRWRLLFNIFFSRWMMGRLGRDPSFFTYVEGSVAKKILARTKHALTELNPAENHYLHWILTGTHGNTLPLAFREEHFDKIRNNLDRLKIYHMTIEEVLSQFGKKSFHRFNLSDIFEYMSETNYQQLLNKLIDSAHSGARLAYWNMLAPRFAPIDFKEKIIHLPLGNELHLKDKAFFYSKFIVEEVR